MQEHEIDAWWRCKDDGLLIARSREKAIDFLHVLFRRSRFSKCQCEKVPSKEVQFLEAKVIKTPTSFRALPAYKSTDICKPLGLESAHAWYVHKSWPKALVRRTMTLSSDDAMMKTAGAMITRRFVSNHANQVQVNWIQQALSTSKSRQMSNHNKKEDTIWLPLSFHPVTKEAMTRALHELRGHDYAKFCFRIAFQPHVDPCFRCPWRNALPTL